MVPESNSSRWQLRPLSEVAEINPRRPAELRELDGMTPVSFVPMAAVCEKTGAITGALERPYSEVRKGFTYFAEGDVLFAKITPCMQNGKSAVASGLANKLGFASTEFHVLRPKRASAEWLHYFVRSKDFRDSAERHFQGSAGQQRVPEDFMRQALIPDAPADAQKQMVRRIKECSSRIEEMQRLREEAEADIKVLENAWLRLRFAELAADWPEQELARFADIKGGGTLPKGTGAQGRNTDLLLIKVGDMNLPGNEFEITCSREYLAASSHNGTWPVGTVVFPKRGGAIATNKKRLLGRSAILDPNLMGVIADPKKMRPPFLLAQFKILDLATLTSGSTVPQLNRKDLAPLLFVVPDLVTQDAVIAQAHAVSSRVRAMAEQNACSAEFEALRESILREAFAGNL